MQNFTKWLAIFICQSTPLHKIILIVLPILIVLLLHIVVTKPWLEHQENQHNLEISMKKATVQALLQPKLKTSDIQKKIVKFCAAHTIIIESLSMDTHMLNFVGSGEYIHLLGLVRSLEEDGLKINYLSQKIDENYTIELTFKIVF